MPGLTAQAGSLPLFFPRMALTPPAIQKAQLRKQLRQARASLSQQYRRHAADRLVRHALRSRLLKRGSRIAFYVPMPSEIDLLPLINQALWMGCECYLPVVPKGQGRRMRFTRIHDSHSWTLNRYRIPEVAAPTSLPAQRLDLVFVPLVGVDQHGYRLGMGGGYYDTTLAFLRQRKVWRQPRLIGAAYDCQRVEQVPREPWDMPLDALLSESGLLRFGHR